MMGGTVLTLGSRTTAPGFGLRAPGATWLTGSQIAFPVLVWSFAGSLIEIPGPFVS